MIEIKKSATADTRSCDFKKVDKETLLRSSIQHINDVSAGLYWFADLLAKASARHDQDKISSIDWFHADFITGFDADHQSWWDNHRKVNRHHLLESDGVPDDVNLIDVLDFITDCVMAGMARSGSVYPLKLDAEILQRAFENTVELMKVNVRVTAHDGEEEVLDNERS